MCTDQKNWMSMVLPILSGKMTFAKHQQQQQPSSHPTLEVRSRKDRPEHQPQGNNSRNHYSLETALEDRNPSNTERLVERSRVSFRQGYRGVAANTTHDDENGDDDDHHHHPDVYQRKVEYRQFGANAHELLRVVEERRVPLPEQSHHVVIRVEASTVTLEDCSIRRGFDFNIWNPIAVPVTPGSDVVGHIVAMGSAVVPLQQQHMKSSSTSFFANHDRVAALVRTGGNARYVSVPYDRIVRLPTNVTLDAADAVAMVSIYTTAYQTLKRIKQKRNSSHHHHHHENKQNGIGKQPPQQQQNLNVFSLAGSTVLVIGGMNAVGQALVQMCQKAKADKIYATGPVHRHSYLQHVLGAIPLPNKGWLEDSGYDIEGKMDFVFDGVNDDIWLDTSYRALKPLTGELVCYGYTAMLREHHMGLLGAPMSAHINKLWSHTLPRAQMFEIWESFQQDPETYKVSTNHEPIGK
jgi:NADPH:quinone reductase-like Zn-dependent oxidoreductase